MNNFIFALQATAHYIQVSLSYIVLQQVLWGFGIGFIAATGMHLMVLGGDLRRTTLLLLRAPDKAFARLSHRAPDGTYLSSYSLFVKEYLNAHILFYGTVLIFLLIVTISLLWY